ncbi:MAG: hypothetical protein IPO83_14595 [Chitinophagaceae bacterium]|nr:hypothetical protein [Chitinophagaceae bacterium]
MPPSIACLHTSASQSIRWNGTDELGIQLGAFIEINSAQHDKEIWDDERYE